MSHLKAITVKFSVFVLSHLEITVKFSVFVLSHLEKKDCEVQRFDMGHLEKRDGEVQG
jgi:hypothetical protein